MKLTDIPETKRVEIEQAIFSNQAAAYADPSHPGWHFAPPAHNMLDVWGGIYFDGWYHIFYGVSRTPQNIHGDTVFGHARSRDLLHFEHLPLPICPAEEELRMNDGCITVNGDGLPVMLYTSVPKEHSARKHYAAIGTKDLRHFSRLPHPFMTLETHGGPQFDWGWSDPFVFSAFGRTFMVMSKCVDPDGRNRMPIYEALDDTCLNWAYRGIMMEDNGEVVNFFPIGDKWVMIFCPYGTIRYFVGTFDETSLTFTPEQSGPLCYGYKHQSNPTDRGFYATSVYPQPDESPNANRTILCGWMSGFPEENTLWCGCMATPREVGLNQHLQVTTMPIREIKELRYSPQEFNGNSGNLEIDAQADLEIQFSGTLLLEIAGCLKILVHTDSFEMNGTSYSFPTENQMPQKLRILLDRSFAELYFDDGVITAVRPFQYSGETLHLHIEGSVQLRAWNLHSVEIDDAR